MGLYRKKGRRVWTYRTMVNGKSWERTTGESNRKKAEAQVPKLQRLARLHRSMPDASLSLSKAIVNEVDRIQSDTSVHQADRAGNGLMKFLEWAGDIPLEMIDDKMVEQYQRHLLAKNAKSTVHKELCFILRLLKENGLSIARPSSKKKGRLTLVRAFTEPELRAFFENCSGEHYTLFLLMLITGARPAELVPSGRCDFKPLLKSELDTNRCIVSLRVAKQMEGTPPSIRTVAIPKELMDQVVAVSKTTPEPFVFSQNQSLAKLFDRIILAAGIPKKDELGRKLVAHSFRHTYGTMMSESVGSNPFLVQLAMGHKCLQTSARYCHPKSPEKVIDIKPFLRAEVA